MEDYSSFYMDIVGFGDEVDIMPLVRAAIVACPYRHDLSVNELADLVKEYGSGKYIPVHVQDRVEGRNTGSLIGFVVSRVLSAYKIEQLRRPELYEGEGRYYELDPWLDVCPAASRLTGRFLGEDELLPLPLAGCWGYKCQCHYSAFSRRALERRGRLNADGLPVPLARAEVRCYDEDHPEETKKASKLYKCRTPRELGTREPTSDE